jgi:hypothetical protein
MSSTGDAISDAMQDAIKGGDVVEPVALLSLIAGIENPIAALSDHDKGNELFDAFYRDFGFIKVARATKKPLSPAEHDRLVGLLRWLISELRQWRRATDARGSKLAALFVAAQACDWDNALWNMIPADIGTNADLRDRLNALISSFAVAFTMRDPSRTPLWEREAVESLKSAEAGNDWTAIASAWRPLEQAIFPNALQIQAVRCLFRCGVTYLADALAHLNQTAVGMVVASTLSTSEKLSLAVATDSPYVQFCCLYQVLSDHRTPKLPLSNEQEQLLIQLLLKVAGNSPRWAAWMQVFNAYPLRYPALQTALGITLADAPDTAIESYVKSIVIYPKQAPTDAGRQAVAACLSAFRSKASLARRTALWTLAHERWTTWEFNRAESNQHIFNINWSELDYAIVGFACECLDAGGQSEAMDLIIGELKVLDEGWYASITDIVTAWNRLLSAFQPYAHAQAAVTSGGDWLSGSQQYYPSDLAKNPYLMMKYRLT